MEKRVEIQAGGLGLLFFAALIAATEYNAGQLTNPVMLVIILFLGGSGLGSLAFPDSVGAIVIKMLENFGKGTDRMNRQAQTQEPTINIDNRGGSIGGDVKMGDVKMASKQDNKEV